MEGDKHVAEGLETIHIPVTVNAKASVWMSFSFAKKRRKANAKSRKHSMQQTNSYQIVRRGFGKNSE